MFQNRIPGICRIEIVRCTHLPRHIMLHSMSGAPLALAVPRLPIRFFGTPTLTWKATVVNGARQEQATLKFASPYCIGEGERLAFIITTAAGRKFLLGTREPNYPVVNFSETTGTPGGEAAVRTYEITHIAPKSVLECTV